MDIILKYFPNLSEVQQQQFAALYDLYTDWNSKINVISRKDITNLYEHHVLHSLGIAKVMQFRPETTVMDLGTGGGFPGIPLAILFPETHFHLVDSIGKKVKVATEIANAIGLKNVTTRHCRAEEEKQLFDFVVSRAVMPLTDLLKIIRKNSIIDNNNSIRLQFINPIKRNLRMNQSFINTYTNNFHITISFSIKYFRIIIFFVNNNCK